MVEKVDIRRGDDGDGVKAVQKLLVKNGATLKADGVFGPVTEQAVKDFQTTSGGLIVDGIVGVHTLLALTG